MKARVAKLSKFPTTMHYRGDGLFMIAGETTSKWRRMFKPEML
jgi:hypothetical protein